MDNPFKSCTDVTCLCTGGIVQLLRGLPIRKKAFDRFSLALIIKIGSLGSQGVDPLWLRPFGVAQDIASSAAALPAFTCQPPEILLNLKIWIIPSIIPKMGRTYVQRYDPMSIQ